MNLQSEFNSLHPHARLLAAVRDRDFAAARTLLEQGVPADCRNVAGSTPLMVAVQNGDLKTAGMLLGYNADPNAFTGTGETVLDTALAAGGDNLVDLLLMKGADVLQIKDKAAYGLLMVRAVARGMDETVAILLGQGISPDLKDSSQVPLLCIAADNKRSNVLETLLKEGADVHGVGKGNATPLRYALRRRDAACVRALLAAGADPGASCSDNDDFMKDSEYADRCGPEIRDAVNAAYKKFQINEAAVAGDDKTVAALLAQGEPPDTFDRNGATALYLACRNGHAAAVKLLVENKADPALATKKCQLPLGGAVTKGSAECVQLLMSAGVKPTQANLIEACGRQHMDVLKLILDAGVDPNVMPRELKAFPEPPDFHIKTAWNVEADDYPLHTAVRNGHAEMAKALIAKGASVLKVNGQNQNVVQLAESMGDADMIKMMKQRRKEELTIIGHAVTRLERDATGVKFRFKPKAG